jgi:hypothetical protein
MVLMSGGAPHRGPGAARSPGVGRARWARRILLVAVLAIAGWAGWQLGAATRPTPPRRVAPAPPMPVFRRDAPPSLAPAGAEVAAGATIHPRAADEWQGMLVDLTQRQYCEASSYCGFALACLDDSACGPCRRDDQCAGGEVCALDHCVRSELADCRRRADCAATGADARCVLTGLTGGEPRGNSEMRAVCLAARGGTPQDEAAPDARRAARLAAAAAQKPAPPPVSADVLRARLDAALSAAR